ncbi:putative MFS transporter [Aspergillus saccharolyticus JOP 1030-1]|uniref:MFS general substrate transporter n=1 Tax=Aspergillus saccharolyticus JOP 1030-1 TaxID=1450539 RepID=A0A318ZP66_9EURO|nr:MFS general substrate transporter [Aspergillus saccharolyticus JOP 1030-1]PYH49411.1 MFS general substrate transporter [Aspergillus saccharolyticus JOP 1030-1]
MSPRTSYDPERDIDKSHVDNVEIVSDAVANANKPNPQKEAPPYVASLTPEERQEAERALVRKIDLRLLPMLIIMYILNYLDRNNIAAAKLAGLQEDLNLVGMQYQTCVSILFVGYLLMQIPSNLLLNKVGKPALYLPGSMLLWGIISTCTAGAQSYAGLVVVRFFLGFVEAAYFPGCLYFLSAWYTRKELGFRTAALYSGSLLSGAFSGLIAAGITDGMDYKMGLRSWRWLFIIEGAITIVVAFTSVFILPNFPRTTSWLTEEEKQLAAWRLEEDIGEDDWVDSEQQTFMHGVKLAFTDIKTYLLILLILGIVSSASVTNFFPTVVKTLNYGNIETLCLTAPPYCLAVITAFTNAWHADRTGERYFHITLPLYISVAAFILAAATTSVAPRYVAMMLMVPSFYASYVVALGWISSTLPRPASKRAAALAGINCISNLSSVYASYMYPDSDAPRYITAMTVNCVTAVLAILAATALRFVLVRLNKKLDRGEGISSGEVPGQAGSRGFRFLV